jgi:hypothetical protein
LTFDHVVEATALLETMAKDRIQRLSSDHLDVEKFWDVYEYLSGLRDIAINHQADTHVTLAINLNDFYKYAADHRQQLPDITIMKRLLPSSRRYRFVESNKAVRSAPRSTSVEDRIIKCWIFHKPQNGARTA